MKAMTIKITRDSYQNALASAGKMKSRIRIRINAVDSSTYTVTLIK